MTVTGRRPLFHARTRDLRDDSERLPRYPDHAVSGGDPPSVGDAWSQGLETVGLVHDEQLGYRCRWNLDGEEAGEIHQHLKTKSL